MRFRFRPHHAPRYHLVHPDGDGHVTTLPVHGVRQARNYTCGFATALMVLRYFGSDIPGLELYRRLGTDRDGTRQSAIVRELRAAGLRANIRYDVDFARVCREIDRNKLIIGYLHDDEHWLVLYGYGRNPMRVFVADPDPDASCEHPWDTYSPRLARFGIICSHPSGSAAVRQTPLVLGEVPEPASPPEAPPPSPLAQLRCEVRYLPRLEHSEPAQLALPFAASAGG